MKVFIFIISGLIASSKSTPDILTDQMHIPKQPIFNRNVLDTSPDTSKCPEKQSGNIFNFNNINDQLIKSENIYGCYDTLTQRLYTQDCNFILYGCIFNKIQNNELGGSIYISYITSADSYIHTSLIEKCQFKLCKGKNGGAIYISTNLFNYEIKLIDNLFENNEGTGSAGAVYFRAQIGQIKDCRFINNHANTYLDIYCTFGKSNVADISDIKIENNAFSHTESNEKDNSLIYITCTATNVKFYFNMNTIKINPQTADPNVHLVLFDVSGTTKVTSDWDFSNNCIFPYDANSISNEGDKAILKIDFEANFIQCKEDEGGEETDSSTTTEIAPPSEITPTNVITLEPEGKCPDPPKGDICDIDSIGTSRVDNVNIYACNINITKRLFTSKCTFLLYGCVFNGARSATTNGAAIYMSNTDQAESEPKITNVIENCQFISCNGNDGGAIYITTTLLCYEVNLINTLFMNNNGNSNGGAVYFRVQVGLIERCKFINNHAAKLAHDIYCDFGSEAGTKSSNIVIRNNLFEHSEENKANSSMIHLSCRYQYENFYFNSNIIKVNAINSSPNVHLFVFNVSAQSVYAHEWDYSNNCISPYDEFLVTSEEDKDILKIDFGANFVNCEESESTPTEMPPFITLDTDNCSSSHRCHAENTQEKKVFVQVLVTKFQDFINESNGGAVHIINCGFECSGTNFTNCVSNSGGGGGIYIKNGLELENKIDLTNLYFSECKAVYGAAICVNSVSSLNPVTIKTCTFVSNSIIESSSADSNNELVGGSAIFIAAKIGVILRCRYRGNIGTGGSIKIYNQYESYSKVLHISSHESNLVINECSFEQDEKSPSSIYYVGGSQESQLEITKCDFKGVLNGSNHYIDGKLISSKSPKLVINLCSFEHDTKNAININLLKSTDIKNNDSKNSLLMILLYTSLCAIGVVFVALALIKITKHSNDENTEFEDDKKSENDFQNQL